MRIQSCRALFVAKSEPSCPKSTCHSKVESTCHSKVKTASAVSAANFRPMSGHSGPRRAASHWYAPASQAVTAEAALKWSTDTKPRAASLHGGERPNVTPRETTL